MHYVCTGDCKGVSDKPGTCQAESCPAYHEDLKPCDCADGQHSKVFNRDEDPDKELFSEEE